MIPEFEKSIEYLTIRCKESGFSGLFVIDEYNSFQNESLCPYSLQFEPLYTMKYGRSELEFKYFYSMSKVFNYLFKSKNLIYSYDLLWKNIIRRKTIKNSFLGAFVDWDNTPRRGENGRIVLWVSARKFKKYLKKLKRKAIKNHSEFIFINAWNEWGEGTYFEPDKKNGKKYLEAVKEVFNT